jgi:adenylate cyclase
MRRTFASTEEEWQAWLTGTHPLVHKGRRTLRFVPSGPRCHLCSAPFGPPGGPLLRRYGFTPWEKNPNVCRRCITQLSGYDVSGAEVDASLLFADVRGSSELARRIGTMEFTRLMQRFYTVATTTLFENEAILDKFSGDAVFGFFLPFMAGAEHPRRAVDTARKLLSATGHGEADGPWVQLGIGVHTGTAFVGLVSKGDSSDFTALGDPVNIAAHLAAQAGPGEILVTAEAAARARLDGGDPERRSLSLKGHPVEAVVLLASGARTEA